MPSPAPLPDGIHLSSTRNTVLLADSDAHAVSSSMVAAQSSTASSSAPASQAVCLLADGWELRRWWVSRGTEPWFCLKVPAGMPADQLQAARFICEKVGSSDPVNRMTLQLMPFNASVAEPIVNLTPACAGDNLLEDFTRRPYTYRLLEPNE